MKKCEEKRCCCSCKSLIVLRKHPWHQVYKGSISEIATYACIVDHDMDKSHIGILLNHEHGECELYSKKDEENV